MKIFMGFDLNVAVSEITVFTQGILSFFSPCILPLIPLYIGYLSGGSYTTNSNGDRIYNQKKVLLNTIFFIIGVSFAFFLLGLGFSAAGQFFSDNKMLFSRIGGVLIVALGLMQLGFLDKPFKGGEARLPIKINALKMNPLTALLMGFTFSFAWTPCVGPALATVLIMISSTTSTASGILLMGIYTLGFVLPFLFVGIFTTQLLNLFKKHQKVVDYTVKIGGVLMILMGVMMFTGFMNTVTGYLSSISLDNTDTSISRTEDKQEQSEDDIIVAEESTQPEETLAPEVTTQPESDVLPAIDFELQDQFGNTHKLEDYKGKVIFLNFWATWCPPCRAEMPDIQKLYEEYGLNEEDVIILGVASPSSSDNPFSQEGSEQEVIDFLAENNYTYPTIMDVKGDLVSSYGISAYPSTFMIDAEGNVFGYVPGMLTYDIMESIISQTIAGEMDNQ